MYTLNQEVRPSGWGTLRRCVFSHEDINEVKKKLCEVVQNGMPLKELSITKEIEFDFKCAVALHTDKEEV